MQPGVQSVDLLDLTRQASCVKPVSDRQPLAVVRDREIFIVARPGRLRHLLNGGRSVAPRRVDVEVATDVGERDEFRQGASAREHDFAAVLAQLWRDKGKAELLVDLLLA